MTVSDHGRLYRSLYCYLEELRHKVRCHRVHSKAEIDLDFSSPVLGCINFNKTWRLIYIIYICVCVCVCVSVCETSSSITTEIPFKRSQITQNWVWVQVRHTVTHPVRLCVFTCQQRIEALKSLNLKMTSKTPCSMRTVKYTDCKFTVKKPLGYQGLRERAELKS
jgi:hypothetical protein